MFNKIVLSFSFHFRSTAHLLRPMLLLVVLLPTLLWISLAPGHATPASAPMPPPGGQIVVTGSVALADLISLWVDNFAELNPGISITIADSGSAVGIEALLNGSADAVLTSTPLSRQQAERFIDRFGYAPSHVPVAMDGVAVYVSSLNPLQQINLTQLDAIYSATLRCGASQPLRNWGQLGVKGALSKDPIATLGLTVDTGAYHLFKHVALCDGDFRTDFQAFAGPAAVEAGLADNPVAIGFSSSALRSAGIKALAIARRKGETAVHPSIQSIQSGRYPLARRLSILLNIPPGRKTSPAIQTFLNYARSTAGQAVTTKAGYVPLPAH